MEATHKQITAEIRDEILAEFRRRFPQVRFIGFWDKFMKAHVIGVSNVEFNHSREYRLALGDMEDKYAPDYDIFDIYFTYEDFEGEEVPEEYR